MSLLIIQIRVMNKNDGIIKNELINYFSIK